MDVVFYFVSLLVSLNLRTTLFHNLVRRGGGIPPPVHNSLLLRHTGHHLLVAYPFESTWVPYGSL